MPVRILALVVALCGAAVPASAQVAPLSLAEAVARAQRDSPLRASAAALAQGAERAAQLAGRPINPFVDLRVENLGGRDNPLVPAYDSFAVASQPVELAGKRGVRRDIAGADSSVAGLFVRALDRQLALDTVRAYMRAVRARDVVRTILAQRDGVDTLVQTMRRRVEEGFSPEADLLRFEAEAGRMALEVSRNQIELSRALLELGTLIGTPSPLDPSQLVSPSALPPPSIPEADLASAIGQRPDVRLAAARVEQARLLSDLERLRRIPDPIVNAGYKRTMGVNTGVAGVTLTVPLFDQNGQARARADAAMRAATLDETMVRVRATAEARAAMAAAAMLAANAARVQDQLLRPAEAVRNAARATFREGAADVLKLVDAERIYMDVQRDALSASVDAYVAAVEARFAVALEEIP
jgi:cobalt-zinc-cadmium efflux system outer membrane protein